MGLFESIFKKERMEKHMQEYFKTFTAYRPTFTTFEGGLYEMELTRAAVHAFATHASKLKPEVTGSGNDMLKRKLQYAPNPYQDTSKFLYRIATILSVNNNAFIVPIYYDDMETIIGYYPLLPNATTIKEYNGDAYVCYKFATGEEACIEFKRAGLLTQYQYYDDVFGSTNNALRPTLNLINTQNQGIVEGVKSSATLRFMARLANVLKDADVKAERKRFTESNLSAENNGGVMMFDAKYADVKQIDSRPYIVDDKQMALINDNVYSYFGVNQDILQNKFSEEAWNAFYEGKIEPFAIQLSLVMTNMTFSEREVAFGNSIMFSANRLQYASNATKLNVVTQLFDRGMLTQNQGLEIFNMPPVDGGDQRYIRGEYINTQRKEDQKHDNDTGQAVSDI